MFKERLTLYDEASNVKGGTCTKPARAKDDLFRAKLRSDSALSTVHELVCRFASSTVHCSHCSIVSRVRCFLALSLTTTGVNGHGYLTIPKATFLESSDPTSFVANIDSSASGLNGKFDGTTVDNSAAFIKAFKSSKYTTLKELINDKATITVPEATLTCGSCDPKGAAQPKPKSIVEWSHSDSEGFSPSHLGPCEVWCDDVRTFQDDDCATHFTMVPAKLPYDRDACVGSHLLSFYWLAMQSSTWQVYINCVALETTTATGATSKYAVEISTSSAQSTSTSSSISDSSSTEATTEAPTVTSGSASGSASLSTTAPSTPSPTTTPSTTSVTTAPSTSLSITTAPSLDCGSYDIAGSESDCGLYNVAGGSESDCGSNDVADSESDCGSYGIAGSESECGSYDVASGSEDAKQATGPQPSFDFSTVQSTADAATVSPQKE